MSLDFCLLPFALISTLLPSLIIYLNFGLQQESSHSGYSFSSSFLGSLRRIKKMESSSTLITSLNQRKSSSSPPRKPPKQKRKTTTTSNNKSIKVRYISNPMRVETCASKFRELVQELTGQDAADIPPEPTTYAAADPHQEEMNHEPLDEGIREYFSPLDDEVFNAPQMSAGLSAFFSSGFYNVNALGSIGSL